MRRIVEVVGVILLGYFFLNYLLADYERTLLRYKYAELALQSAIEHVALQACQAELYAGKQSVRFDLF